MIQAYMRLLLSLGAAHPTNPNYAAMGIPTVTVWRLELFKSLISRGPQGMENFSNVT